MKFRKTLVMIVLGACLLALPIQARADFYSNHDGVTDDGAYRIQVELTPYVWLPATSGNIGFARQRIADRFSGNFSTAVPSVSNLASSLHFSFMGDSVFRYGPYSAEMDLQYVDGSKSSNIGRFNNDLLRVNASASYVRVAPGIGYRVYSGDFLGVPVAADARVGFAYFSQSAKLKGEGLIRGQITGDGDFIQPWFGGRVDFVPSPRIRIELSALAQGLGVSGGSWGWGADLIGSYAFSSWFAADAGFRALSTERKSGNRGGRDADGRSLSLTGYGPVVGATLRF